MSEQTKDSGWKKAYLVLRWPVAFGLFGISAVFFLIGLLNSLGYNGTTELRAINKGSSEWTNFNNSFASSDAARRGRPFTWKGSSPEEREDGALNFDKRLVAAFKYLRDANNKTVNTCGWDGQHELLSIDVEKLGGQWSIYSVPSDKTTPISTIYRGVGARISSADRIKCTEYQNPTTLSSGGVCTEALKPKKWPNDDIPGFPIPLALNAMLNPDPIPYDNVNCRVTCAIDYYPVLGDPVDSKAPTYAASIVKAAGFNPAATTSEYKDINSLSHKAARLKSLLLAYELMHIDDAGCQSSGGNSGLNRAIPITLITQGWLRQDLGDKWAELMKIAQSRFPFNFQDSSRLAGLAADPLIDNLGLHFNY